MCHQGEASNPQNPIAEEHIMVAKGAFLVDSWLGFGTLSIRRCSSSPRRCRKDRCPADRAVLLPLQPRPICSGTRSMEWMHGTVEDAHPSSQVMDSIQMPCLLRAGNCTLMTAVTGYESDLRQCRWKTWPQGRRLLRLVAAISSRQMMQTPSQRARSSAEASGKRSSMLAVTRR